jgi:hypothetical protein
MLLAVPQFKRSSKAVISRLAVELGLIERSRCQTV